MDRYNILERFHTTNTCSIIVLVFFSIMLFSCKKNQPKSPIETQIEVRKEKIISNLDSLYAYAEQIYLWNSDLPNHRHFNPVRFYNAAADNEIDIYKDEIFAFTRLAVNPSNNRPFELNVLKPAIPKYSSLIETGFTNVQPNYDRSDNVFGLAFAGTLDGIRILYADMNSPAWQAGMRRGQKVISINNEKAVSTSSYYNYISSVLNGNSLSIVVESFLNGLSVNKTITLKKQYFVPSPILKSLILDIGDKKVGYIAYKSFTDEASTRQFLDPVLYQFAASGISELIVDLRYNTGGYQNTCKYLANCFAPRSANGKLMFTEYYNSRMQAGTAYLLANQQILGFDNKPIYINGKIATLLDIDYSPEANRSNFEIEGPLSGLKKVSFIISSQTASASELLINVLKPYMKVQLVGVSTDGSSGVKTYGKPVGFFDIKIDRFKVYLAMYQTKNANGEGDFFEGLVASTSTLDNVSVDFGDLTDPAITSIVSSGVTAGNASNKIGAVSKKPIAGGTITTGVKEYIQFRPIDNGLIKAYNDFKFKKN